MGDGSSLDKYGWLVFWVSLLVGCTTLPVGGFGVLFFGFALAGLFFIIGPIYDEKHYQKEKASDLKFYLPQVEKLFENHKKYQRENGYFETSPLVWNLSNIDELNTSWKFNNKLYLMVSEQTIKSSYSVTCIIDKLKMGKTVDEIGFSHLSIPLEMIEFFQLKGEIKQFTKTYGGGSSLSGAIIGGIVAGEVGAIIGSRKESTTETFTNDERNIEMFLKVNGEVKIINLDRSGWDALIHTIPEKHVDYVRTTLKL
jgi:hypothetical protein